MGFDTIEINLVFTFFSIFGHKIFRLSKILWNYARNWQQAGTELCQAQSKLIQIGSCREKIWGWKKFVESKIFFKCEMCEKNQNIYKSC